MSESCCSEVGCSVTPAKHERSECPVSGSAGEPVDWTTVAALANGRVPPKQEFRLCRDPDCEVVYFGSAGTLLRLNGITAQPGFKTGSDGLVCYCFLHREKDVVRQIAESGRTDILESITAEVQAGNCACEVRNPSGKCCLGEVEATIRRVAKEREVTA